MGTVNAVPFLFEENIMSCPTWLRLENLKEGTQKRIYINLGWVPPTDFQMAEILINAVKEVSDTYEWERLYFPLIGLYMTRNKFEEMKLAVIRAMIINSQQRFTLKNAWSSE